MQKNGQMIRMFSLSKAILVLFFLAVFAGVTLVQADSPNRVGLVVVHGDGEVVTQCIEFSESQITGYEVLERSGLDLNADVTGGIGSAICRLDNEGCSFPAEDCFCQCQGALCTFWIYWNRVGDDWRFSTLGASSRQVQNGDVEGWVWGEGNPSGGGTEPPDVLFDEICLPATHTPTSTVTPTDMPTPTETPSPYPTNTPAATGTPTPVPTPEIHNFSASQTSIRSGDSVQLSWNLEGAEAVYLQYNGVEEPVVAPGSKTVAPDVTTVYTLVARNGDSQAEVELTITVESAVLVATPTHTAAAMQAEDATSISLPSATPMAEVPSISTDQQEIESVAEVDESQEVISTATAVSTSTLEPATSVAVVITPTTQQNHPLPEPKPYISRQDNVESSGSTSKSLFFYGGVGLILVLFMVVPIVLFSIGGAAWWMSKRK
jgi:hypothetical protein